MIFRMAGIAEFDGSYLDLISRTPSSIVNDVKNLNEVFLTISSRPQLIFDNIRYCVLDQRLHSFPVENSISSEEEEMIKYCIGTNYKETITEMRIGEVLISHPQDELYKMIGCLSPSMLLIYFLKIEEKSIHSFVFLSCQNSKAQLKLFSRSWENYDYENIVTQKKAKLEKWLTIDTFVNKPIPNNLVCPKQYYLTYSQLKDKYYNDIFSAWDMQTDPEKFIHEDIGIASYLICVWNARYGETARDHVKFVDIGCGNGLLVYILNQEKFHGIGIDVKSRNMWNTLFSKSTYHENFFDPKNWTELAEYNWLIGNHSDELTPWIPYVSLMLSYHCEFFVLPCCAWNFTSKFSRVDSSRSTYQCYLDLIESVISDFGFKFDRDIMKIPSTKRTCFVSDGRNFPLDDNKLVVSNAINLIRRHSCSDKISCVPRSREIKVRNATKINKDLCNNIVDFTTSILLKNVCAGDPIWSPGKSVHLKDLIFCMKQNILFQDALKNQDGGIKTVLKNNHQIFIIRNGQVSLKNWAEDVKKPKKYQQLNKKYDSVALRKSKSCWFYEHHPQGCNLSLETCQYAHGIEDLRLVTSN